MPALPLDLRAATDAGHESTLAFTMEAARLAHARGEVPAAALGEAFTRALAALIRRALRPGGGDPAYQAQVLQSRDPQVQEWAALAATSTADARQVRSTVDALAHPGKLHAMAPGPLRHALQALHARAAAADWPGLASQAGAWSASDAPLQLQLQALAGQPALQRLIRAAQLAHVPAVRRHAELRAMRHPAAGSDEALLAGREASKTGAQAEDAAAQALDELVHVLHAGEGRRLHLWRSLRTPARLTRAAARAKEEWDVAITEAGPAGDDIILMAEVKASPAAATTDLPRLLRGLAQLGQAQPDAIYEFAAAAGSLRVSGASLRALHPAGQAIAPQVIYLCTASADSRTSPLGSAAKALLMNEPVSLAFAAALDSAETPELAALAPVWNALAVEGTRLGPALWQFELARLAREAMLHPDDLRAAIATVAAQCARAS